MTTANPPVTLAKGSHDYDGTDDCPRCLFEAYNLIKRDVFTDDCPPGVSPVLHVFGVRLNDCLPDDARQSLVRYLPNGSDPLDGTDSDGRDETRSYMALDWLVRTYLPRFLDLSPLLAEHADAVRGLERIDSRARAELAGPAVAAAGAAARDAARDAAGAAAGDAARDAARDVARVAGTAAWDAARDAARDAASAVLNPVVIILQESALALYDQMIKGTWND